MGYKSSPESLGVVQACPPRPAGSADLEHWEPGWRWPQRGLRHRVQCQISQWVSSPDRGPLPAWLPSPLGGVTAEHSLQGYVIPVPAGQWDRIGGQP